MYNDTCILGQFYSLVSLNKPYIPAMALHTPTSNCNFYSGKEKYRIQIGNPLSKKRVTKSLNQA